MLRLPVWEATYPDAFSPFPPHIWMGCTLVRVTDSRSWVRGRPFITIRMCYAREWGPFSVTQGSGHNGSVLRVADRQSEPLPPPPKAWNRHYAAPAARGGLSWMATEAVLRNPTQPNPGGLLFLSSKCSQDRPAV